jgi:hypothetical protein
MAKRRKRKNAKPLMAKVSGWVKAKAVKITRNKAGRAVSVKIKT